MSRTGVPTASAGVRSVGTVDQVYVYWRVPLQSVTTPPVEEVARSRQKKVWLIVGGSVRVKFVLFVVNELAPTKSGASSISRVDDLAPASGGQRNSTGCVVKSNASTRSGAVIVGAAPHSFVNAPLV